MTPYDNLEMRSAEDRAASLRERLPAQVAFSQALPGHADRLSGIDPDRIKGRDALATLPVPREADLASVQGALPPLGGLTVRRAVPGPARGLCGTRDHVSAMLRHGRSGQHRL